MEASQHDVVRGAKEELPDEERQGEPASQPADRGAEAEGAERDALAGTGKLFAAVSSFRLELPIPPKSSSPPRPLSVFVWPRISGATAAARVQAHVNT